MSLFTFCQWLNETPWSIALRESIWVYPIIESTHLLTLSVFFGLTAFMDLRLLGVSLLDIPADLVMHRLLPLIRASFGLMAVTGLLLFYSAPAGFYGNVFFRGKLLLLAGAALNIWLFHSGIGRSAGEWGASTTPPARARVAGGMSIALWVSVISAGRLIAYNWFK